jgi:hypothetical protein
MRLFAVHSLRRLIATEYSDLSPQQLASKFLSVARIGKFFNGLCLKEFGLFVLTHTLEDAREFPHAACVDSDENIIGERWSLFIKK